MPTVDDYLTLSGVSTVGVRFAFVLLDERGGEIGRLEPDAASPIQIRNSALDPIKRTFSGMVLPATDANEIDPLRHRVRIDYYVGGLYAGPLGVFYFGTPTDAISTRGTWRTIDGFDANFVLAQGRRHSFRCRAGDSPVDAIAALLAEVNLAADLTSTAVLDEAIPAEALYWPKGTDRRKIISDLCSFSGFYDGYFDASGTFTLRPVPDDSTLLQSVERTYAIGGAIAADSITTTDSIYAAPNTFVVLSSTSKGGAIMGAWRVPAGAPHSVENRGYEIVDVYNAQGINSKAQAEAMARSRGRQSRKQQYQTIEFSTPPDPRVDTFTLLSVLGEVYLSVGWEITCAPGATMKHSARRQYAA